MVLPELNDRRDRGVTLDIKTSCFWLIAFCGFNCCAATNGVSSGLFLIPHLELRRIPGEPLDSAARMPRELTRLDPSVERQVFTSAPSVRETLSLHDELAATRDDNLHDTFARLDIYRRLKDGGYLTPRVVASENKLTRLADSTFNPATFHIGRTATLECSLLTAIKHLNPLCLVTQNFLSISW